MGKEGNNRSDPACMFALKENPYFMPGFCKLGYLEADAFLNAAARGGVGPVAHVPVLIANG